MERGVLRGQSTTESNPALQRPGSLRNSLWISAEMRSDGIKVFHHGVVATTTLLSQEGQGHGQQQWLLCGPPRWGHSSPPPRSVGQGEDLDHEGDPKPSMTQKLRNLLEEPGLDSKELRTKR